MAQLKGINVKHEVSEVINISFMTFIPIRGIPWMDTLSYRLYLYKKCSLIACGDKLTSI